MSSDTVGPGYVPTPPDAATLRRWGLEPEWSRTIDVASHLGGRHTWHVLDTGVPETGDADATILCVHGNPTWGYVWSTWLRTLGARHRVIAVDQLGMGYSERTRPRRYRDRVRDLDDVIVALGISGASPLVVAGHDWGGAVAMGWVVQDPHQVAGMVLCNTGLAVPSGRNAPAIIRLAAWAPLTDFVCRGTPIFVEGASRLSLRRIARVDREALRAPYRTAPLRAAIADFVDDIPLTAGAPSASAIADVAARVGAIEAPVLLAFGAKDPVFGDDFADDLAVRFPNVERHRFADAGHLVMLEADVAGVVARWTDDLLAGRLSTLSPLPAPEAERRAVWAAIEERRNDDAVAFVDARSGDRLTWRQLAARVDAIAADLAARGVRPGDRVAMLTPPGIDLVAVVYGVWRAGGVTVIADRGLGLRGLGRAIRSTGADWIIGPRRALTVATALRWSPRATALDISGLAAGGAGEPPPAPGPEAPAAVLFTSGATGIPKGVRYRHAQLEAQRDALARTYSISDTDRLVAAFAPFVLYGPALGIPSALPDTDVTAPATLSARALGEAVRAIDATVVFASPSALANVVDTAAEAPDTAANLAQLRLVLSAGAPVPAEVLRAVGRYAPTASLHTPYGMTEVLPVADIDLVEIERADADDPAGGVCVGAPVVGAEVRIAPLDTDPARLGTPLPAGVTGEIIVRADWLSEGYDGLWAIQRDARPVGDGTWHRTGDVGHVDQVGRLWVEGRAAHVIRTADGPVTPVPIERRVARALGRSRTSAVAAVGVGPSGGQQIVVVVEEPAMSAGIADADLAAQVRAALDVPLAAVLTIEAMPVDARHNAKIDRTELAEWAERLLAGGRPGRLR